MNEPAFLEDNSVLGAVFALTGTILDLGKVEFAALVTACRSQGATASVSEFAKLIGRTPADRRKLAAKIASDACDFSAAEKIADKVLEEFIEQFGVQLKPGALRLLELLKSRGCVLAINTCASREQATKLLELAEIDSYFDVVVTGDDVQHGKPHPESFLRACSELNLAPEQCVAFEDCQPGARAAIAANVPVIVIPELYTLDDETVKKALKVLPTLEEATTFLKGGC